MWTALYMPMLAEDKEDPTKHGFKTEEEAWNYATSHFCDGCRQSGESSCACSYQWSVLPTVEFERAYSSDLFDSRMMAEPTMVQEVSSEDVEADHPDDYSWTKDVPANEDDGDYGEDGETEIREDSPMIIEANSRDIAKDILDTLFGYAAYPGQKSNNDNNNTPEIYTEKSEKLKSVFSHILKNLPNKLVELPFFQIPV